MKRPPVCVLGRARPAAKPAEAPPRDLHAGYCRAPQPCLPSLEGPWSRPRPAGLTCSPSRIPRWRVPTPPRARPTLCPPRPAQRPPPTVGALLRGPVPLGPLCRVPAGFRTACLTVYTGSAEKRSGTPSLPPSRGTCTSDTGLRTLTLQPRGCPPHPGHQNSASMRHPPGF